MIPEEYQVSEFWWYQIFGVLMVLAIGVIARSWWARSKSTPVEPPADHLRVIDAGMPADSAISAELKPRFHKLLLQQLTQKDNLVKLLLLQTRNLAREFDAEDKAVKAALAVMVEDIPRLEETSPELKEPERLLSTKGFNQLNEMIVVRDKKIRELQLHIKVLQTRLEERKKTTNIQ